MKSILIAANNYPTTTDPVHTFLEQLAVALAKKGIKVTVIAPFRIVTHYVRHNELHPKKRKISVPGGETITVLQPRYFTLPSRFERFNLFSAKRTVYKTASRLRAIPDVCYGHFWHWTYAIYPYAKKNNIPLFANTSETPIILQDIYPIERISDFINTVKGVICASSFCREQSIKKGLAVFENCQVIPNSVNPDLFFKKNKYELRRQYGFGENDFIIAYSGWYSNDKGSNRLAQAIIKLNDKDIKSFFIGEARRPEDDVECPGILHRGRLPHSKMPDYYNMADVFVLPTLAEGCSNAIVEAMACGLPVISSNLPFNWDVLNERNSIMVDPMNVDEIAEGIKVIKSDSVKRDGMSKAALSTAAELTIDQRAEKIISFIESKLLEIK